MSTLLLRFAAPLQSWGVESKFETRRTLGFPTKSGVIGLLAAALGYSRDEPLERFEGLRFGVRIDNEGELLRDYHTAKGKKDKDAYITYRYYLADACFLVGLECDDVAFLKELEYALKHPVFSLYFGRRSCVPTLPLILRITDESLLDALSREAWLLPEWKQKIVGDKILKIILDSDNSNFASILRDVPMSFSQSHRKFAFRPIIEKEVYVEYDNFAGL